MRYRRTRYQFSKMSTLFTKNNGAASASTLTVPTNPKRKHRTCNARLRIQQPAGSRRTHAKPWRWVVGVVFEEHAKDAHTPFVDLGSRDTCTQAYIPHTIYTYVYTSYAPRVGDTLHSSSWGKHNRSMLTIVHFIFTKHENSRLENSSP